MRALNLNFRRRLQISLLTFEENLGREDLNGLILMTTQVLNRRVVEHLGVGLTLQDSLLAPDELFLRVRLQIRSVHIHSSFLLSLI